MEKKEKCPEDEVQAAIMAAKALTERVSPEERGTLADYGLPQEDTVLDLAQLSERQMEVVRQVSEHSPRWLGAMRHPWLVDLVGLRLGLPKP